RGVATPSFFLAEDAELDPGGAHDLHQGARHLLLTLVERAGAADEEEVLELRKRLRLEACGHRDVEIGAPFGAAVAPHAPGIALTLHAFEHPRCFFGEAALHQD